MPSWKDDVFSSLLLGHILMKDVVLNKAFLFRFLGRDVWIEFMKYCEEDEDEDDLSEELESIEMVASYLDQNPNDLIEAKFARQTKLKEAFQVLDGLYKADKSQEDEGVDR